MTRPTACVVDASVGAKLYSPEPLHELAHGLFDDPDGSPAVRRIVPDLFFVECASSLRKLVMRRVLTIAEAVDCVEQLESLDVEIKPSRDLLALALQWALKQGISIYDALYAATAAANDVPLITADGRLVRALEGSPCAVIGLASLDASRG
jgi:predicted nucleic acid-binding protein